MALTLIAILIIALTLAVLFWTYIDWKLMKLLEKNMVQQKRSLQTLQDLSMKYEQLEDQCEREETE